MMNLFKKSIGLSGLLTSTRVKKLFVISASLSAMTCLVNAATRTAASASLADVSAAVAAAARGDTVLVPAGSSTWSGSLTLTRGISLKGAGRDSTTVTSSGLLISIDPDATAIANEEVIRVEGFTFDGANSALNLITVAGAGPSDSKPFKNLAIGNNRLRNSGTGTSGSGAVSIHGQVRGAIYNNIFDRVNVVAKVMGNDNLTEWSNGHFPFAYGNADNLFFENNLIQYSSPFGGADPGWIETGQGGRMVVRYCTWNMANASQAELWDIHGFQNWGSAGQTGTMIVEYYGNTALNCTGYRWVNHRGSWGMFHNNIVSGSGGMGIEINQYAPGDIGGSGCTGDVPGASGVYKTEVNNTYIFNNTLNGSVRNMSGAGGIGDGCGVTENNGYWNYNPSFNGTGIGVGTTPPTGSCSVGSAYWVASSSSPTTNASIIQSATLYKCLSPNVWTAYYKPYAYPHPLSTGTSIVITNPVISLSVSSLDFGPVAVGSTNDLTITVRNVGAGTLSGSASVPAPFSIVGASSYSLVSNATQVLTVRYRPTVAGASSQTVTFTGGGGATTLVSGSAVAALSGSFDSTAGAISAPFAINPDNSISQSVETTDPTAGGRAVYLVNIANAGAYSLAASAYAPGDSANSFFVNFDTEPDTTMVWDIPVNTGFTSQFVTWRATGGVTPQVWLLSAGQHQLIIRGREAGAELGRISIVSAAPAPPQGLRIVSQ